MQTPKNLRKSMQKSTKQSLRERIDYMFHCDMAQHWFFAPSESHQAGYGKYMTGQHLLDFIQEELAQAKKDAVREYNVKQNRNQRLRYKRKGLCRVCGKKPLPDRTLCDKHTKMQRIKQMRWKSKLLTKT